MDVFAVCKPPYWYSFLRSLKVYHTSRIMDVLTSHNVTTINKKQ